jgi:hypothetical protein
LRKIIDCIFSVFNELLNLKNHYLNLYILDQLVDNNNNNKIKLNLSEYFIDMNVCICWSLDFFLLLFVKSIQKIILTNKSFISHFFHMCITSNNLYSYIHYTYDEYLIVACCILCSYLIYRHTSEYYLDINWINKSQFFLFKWSGIHTLLEKLFGETRRAKKEKCMTIYFVDYICSCTHFNASLFYRR